MIRKESKIENKKIKLKNTNLMEISPSYINFKNPQYIEIENKYSTGILIVDYYREQNDLILKNLIDSNVNINVSIFVEKQNPEKIIKDLTYNIGNTSVSLNEKNKNRQDFDIIAFTYDDAKYIRKQIQIEGEEFYFLYIYVNVIADTTEELKTNVNKVRSILESTGIKTRLGYFRQEQIYISVMPLMMNMPEIKNATRKNVLTSGLVSTYPFISNSIFDKDGIFIGRNIYNNSLVFIDRYDENKYKNANMCVFGTSGAGKSYYVKLNIIRLRLLGINQYIIDPEREYINLCNNLGGTLIKMGPNSNTYVNVFDITKESVEDGEKGYLASKIIKLIGFFRLIFGDINEEEKGLIEEKIINIYNAKGINFDDKSLYKENKFKKSEDMPILEDLFLEFSKDKRTEKFKLKLLPFIKGSLSFFNKYTNIEMKDKLIVADVYDLGEENLKYAMYIFMEIFWNYIKKDRKIKKAIYIDEIWRLIGITSNREVASFVYNIFKTIRKYGGSAVAITQDIADLFSLDNGNFGRSILNNSSIKNFFALEEENVEVLKKYGNISEKEENNIKTLMRGETLMLVGKEHILVKVEKFDYEDKIINDIEYKKELEGKQNGN